MSLHRWKEEREKKRERERMAEWLRDGEWPMLEMSDGSVVFREPPAPPPLAREFPDPQPVCPSGWYPFGMHAGWDSGTIPWLEFSEETDSGGMPLWERPRAWVPMPARIGPMTGEQLVEASGALGSAIADHWAEHDGGPNSADESCDEFCTARVVLAWLEREAERQEDARAREAESVVPVE